MATKSKKTRRPRYSDEQIAQFKEQDNALIAAADEALARSDAGARAAAVVLGDGAGRSDFCRMATYSLRNQMMLMEQASKLGIPLCDVDSFDGWMDRKRRVCTGERARLRIAMPITPRKAANDSDGGAAATGEDEDQKKPMFRLSARFEFAQTRPATDDEFAEHLAKSARRNRTPAPVPSADPAEAWSQRLTRDCEQLGYAVAVDAAATAVTVDDDARAITVPRVDTGDTATVVLTQLAQVVAERLTARKATKGRRPATPETAEAATPVLRFG